MISRSQKLLLPAGIFLLLGIVWHYVWMSGDGWWYLALGRELFALKRLPDYNHLAFTGHWTKALHQQWLPYIVYFGLFKLKGYWAVYALTAAFITAGFGAALAAARDRGASVAVGIVFSVFGAFALWQEFSVRSEPFVDMLFGIEVWLFSRSMCGKRAPFWLLVPMFILWANCHSSLPLAIAYPIVLGIGRWVDERAGKDEASGAPAVWLIIAIAATMINPYGPIIYKDIVNRLLSPSVNMIEIFRSPEFHDPRMIVQGLWIILLWAGLLVSPRRPAAADLAIAGAFTLLFLNAQRYIVFLIIATLPIASLHWGEIVAGRLRPAWKAALTGACLLGGIFFFSTPRYFVNVAEPVRQAAYAIKDAGVKGNIFNYYTWGGYILWEHPELNIFIDGRNNLYEESGVFDDYRLADSGGREWNEVLNIYQINAVLWPRWETGLFNAISSDPGWQPLYIRGEASVFLRVTPENIPILQKYRIISP